MLDSQDKPTPNSETLADWIIVLLCIVVLCLLVLNGGL